MGRDVDGVTANKCRAELQDIFGRNFKRARVQAGLSQVVVSQLSGVNREVIGIIERGKNNSTLRILVKLALSVGGEVPEMLTAKSID